MVIHTAGCIGYFGVGLDGRYIVLGSRTTGFKNLTTSDTVDYKKEPVVVSE